MRWESFFDQADTTSVSPFLNSFREVLGSLEQRTPHGRQGEWDAHYARLHRVRAKCVRLDQATVQMGASGELSDAQDHALQEALEALIPWRKGPFEVFGTHIDTEWRSDWKWDRIGHALGSLKGRVVLDVGCGSGYHCWRMMGEGARYVLGIEPVRQYVEQFRLLSAFAGHPSGAVLPLGIESLPAKMRCFDTVFSMGLLYHRKAPLQHLEELRDALVSGGELLLETLVVDGPLHHVLVPEDRYAQMRNVWFLPSVPTLLHWLRRVGFVEPQVVDVNLTTVDEQRSTDWMRFHSLAQFLHPTETHLTIEGHPRPVRAAVIAKAP